MDNRVKECKYSVLMSVYHKDNPEYLKLAIESMLNQTVKPEQYVIVKDGPLTKGLDEVIAYYYSNDPDMFTIVVLEKNGGLPAALNAGMVHCRNELVARMDADDISLPERCEKELEIFLAEEETVICGCSINEFNESPEKITTSRIVPTEYEDIVKFMRKRTPFNHPTVMYKKSKVEEFGGYAPEIKRKQDFDLFSRMINGGCYVRNVDGAYLLFRADEGNYARRKSLATLKNAFRVYGRHLLRGGCNLFDYIVICGGEIVLFILPPTLMKKVSDKILRN